LEEGKGLSGIVDILCLTATYYSGTGTNMLAGTTTSTKDMHLERECAPHAGISSFFFGYTFGTSSFFSLFLKFLINQEDSLNCPSCNLSL
jgi:hypothetical protein